MDDGSMRSKLEVVVEGIELMSRADGGNRAPAAAPHDEFDDVIPF